MRRGLILAIFLSLVPFITSAAAPSPTCGISTPPGTHYAGQPAVLVWYTQYATVASISGVGQVGLQGSQTVYPMQSMMYTMTVGNGQVTKTCSVVISIQAQVTQAPILYYPAYQQAVPFSQYPILFQPIRTPYVSNATGNYGNSGNYYTSNWYSPSDAYNTYNIGTSYPYSYGGLSYNCVGGGLNGESLCYGTSNGSLVGAGYGYTYPIDSPIVGAGYGYTFPLGSSYETSPSGAGTGAGDVSPYVQITGPPGDTYQVTSNSANILNFDNSSSNTGFQVTPNSSNWLNFDNSNPNADSQVTQYPSNLLNFDNNSNATLYVQPDSPQLFYGPDGSFDPGNLDSSPSDKFFQPDNTPLNI